ncbi:MAG: hypothetical protein MR637_07800 [Clostridiales bacterium]|nr:hypothetical protein [Clostridiales bacterium]
MEIYDEKMERIVDPDLTLGWLEDTVRRVEHEEVPAVQEIWHYETAAEYENGGRDVVKVVDVPGVPAREAWEENVPIQIYHPYTQEQLEEIEAEKNRPTQEERLARMEEAMGGMMAVLEQLETDVRAAMAWMMQKEA